MALVAAPAATPASLTRIARAFSGNARSKPRVITDLKRGWASGLTIAAHAAIDPARRFEQIAADLLVFACSTAGPPGAERNSAGRALRSFDLGAGRHGWRRLRPFQLRLGNELCDGIALQEQLEALLRQQLARRAVGWKVKSQYFPVARNPLSHPLQR